MGNFRSITNKPQAGASSRQVEGLGVGGAFGKEAIWLAEKKPQVGGSLGAFGEM